MLPSFALWATEDERAGVSNGAVAQLGERLLCKQEVTGSIPVGSTKSRPMKTQRAAREECDKSPQAASSASGRGRKKVVAAKQ